MVENSETITTDRMETRAAGTRSARSDETRRRLVETATRLFAERGYDGTSVKELAASAGISQGSIFWHFGSKQGLLFEVVDSAFASWEREVLAPLIDSDGAPADLTAIVDSHRSFARRNPQIAGHLFFALISDAIGRRPELREAYSRMYERFRGHALAWIGRAIGDGHCRSDVDPAAVAALMVGAMAGISLQNLIGGDTIDFDRAHDDLARVLERGLRPSTT